MKSQVVQLNEKVIPEETRQNYVKIYFLKPFIASQLNADTTEGIFADTFDDHSTLSTPQLSHQDIQKQNKGVAQLNDMPHKNSIETNDNNISIISQGILKKSNPNRSHHQQNKNKKVHFK